MSANALADLLDELASHRTPARVAKTLSTLEKLVAQTCLDPQSLLAFTKLQDRLDCNVASRLSMHLVYGIDSLQSALSGAKGVDTSEAERVVASTVQALNILQGMALIHPPSKGILGRPLFLRTLLDILAICRQPLQPAANGAQVSSHPSTSATAPSSRPPLSFPSLALSVLDTLLCLLVDAPLAIRAFEACEGVEAVVKILKRSERDVRIKSLEFLYFYLLPEDGERVRPSKPLVHVLKCDAHEGSPLRPQQAAHENTAIPPVRTTTPFSKNEPTTRPTECVPSAPAPKSNIFSTPPTSPSKSAFARSTRADLGTRTPSSAHQPNSAAPIPISPTKGIGRRVSHHPPHLSLLRPGPEVVEFVPMSPEKKQTMDKPYIGLGHPKASSTSSFDDGHQSDASSSPRRKASPMPPPGLGGAKKFPPHPPRRATPTLGGVGVDARRKPSFPRTGAAAADPDASRSFAFESPQAASPLPSRHREREREREREKPAVGAGGGPHTPSRKPALGKSSSSPSKSSAWSASPSKDPSSPSKEQFSPSKSKSSSPSKSIQSAPSFDAHVGTRSTEDKKALLGVWLGNVNALVEGVQRAGIWGLE